MKYHLIAWLGLVLSAATGATADCGSYTSCTDCVRANCAYSDAICYDSCDEVSAVNDCFAFENYVGVDSAVDLCRIAGAEVPAQAVPNIGGSATIGEEEEDEEEEEDGADCPEPSGDGFCTTDYNPVVCGDEIKCGYSNACTAGVAGFDAENDCVLVNEEVLPETECPPMGEGMCTMEYLPVLCGESNCEYSNSCNAALAGFNPDEDCTLKEPAEPESGETECPPMGEGMCTMEYMPVLCGESNCEYSNGCNAALAGFNPDEDCTLKEPAEPESTGPIAITIASEMHLTYFTGLATDLDLDLTAEEYEEIAGHLDSFYTAAFQEDPVFSGDFISYSTTMTETTYTPGGSPNIMMKFDADYVFANGSAITADQVLQKMESVDYVELLLNYLHSKPPENQLDRVQAVEFLGTTQSCPPVGEGICTMEYMPILCGDNNCEYDNGCNAELAGFNPDTECILMEDSAVTNSECPMAGPGVCTFDYVPVVCGDMKCEYSNACTAELAGYDADTDCALVAEMMEHDMGNMTMDSACSMLPTCDSCLNARLKGCVWTAGMCSEECVADASCWSPSIQGENTTGPELCAMAADDVGTDNFDAMGENGTDSACSNLPTCESCLNARLKGCVWTAGMCSEDCVADASCWSPWIQGENMTGPELCAMAEEDLPSEEVDVVTSRTNVINAAQEEAQEEVSAAAVVVQEGILAVVATIIALVVLV